MGKTWVPGEIKEVRLSQGLVRYREVGEGEPVVFAHGLLVNGDHWRDVVPPLAERFRCVVPDLLPGSYLVPLDPDANISSPGLARLITDVMAAPKLRDVALVDNDTGDAICQLVVTRHPEHIARLVLANCDAFENFLPPLLHPFQYGVRILGFASLVARLLRTSLGQRLIIGMVANRRSEPEILGVYLAPITRDAGVRRYVNKVVRDISNRYTLKVVQSFLSFRKPVPLALGRGLPVLPLGVVKRLQRAFQTRSSSGSLALTPSSPRISRGCWPSTPRISWSRARMSTMTGNLASQERRHESWMYRR